MYTTRKNNGAPWDDDVHSLRGLEDVVNQRFNEKTRQSRRQDYVRAVLAEQERLKSAAGQEELATASQAIHKSAQELQAELLRGISCSHSKGDKHRAVALGMKDEKSSSCSRHGSARKLMSRVRSRLNVWASSSSRNLLATSVEGDKASEEEEDKESSARPSFRRSMTH